MMRSLPPVCWALALAPLLAIAFPSSGPDSHYNATDNQRPWNITGLNYDYYPYTGSYYNGTVKFTLNLRNDTESSLPNKVCSDFIYKNLEIEWNAMVTIAKPSPSDAGTNPVLFIMRAWEKGFNLTGDYNDYQFYSSYSILQGQQPRWYLSMSNKSRSDGAYEVVGNHTIDYLANDEVAFNLTQICPPRGANFVPESEEDDYLFRGTLLQPYPPGVIDDNATSGWATGISTPDIQIVFDASWAAVDIGGMFSLRSAHTELVGFMTAEFQGDMDTLRSDQLVLGKTKPEWAPTLGFDGQTLESEGARRAVLLGGGLFVLALLVPVLFLAL